MEKLFSQDKHRLYQCHSATFAEYKLKIFVGHMSEQSFRRVFSYRWNSYTRELQCPAILFENARNVSCQCVCCALIPSHFSELIMCLVNAKLRFRHYLCCIKCTARDISDKNSPRPNTILDVCRIDILQGIIVQIQICILQHNLEAQISLLQI